MIFVDMDGVLADFDGHYQALFGYRPTRWPERENVDWSKIRAVGNFYRTLPLLEGANELLAAIRPRPHSILTGVPGSVDTSSNQKIDWARDTLSPHVPPVICCRSREKCKHGKPGDILIDDYLKYKDLWTDMGGIFIHHTSAAESIRQLLTIESS